MNPSHTHIIIDGLPAVGKSTLAKALAQRLKATYIRIDTIEQAIREGISHASYQTGPEGYLTGYYLAEDNLKMGMTVIADSVNALTITREGWLKTAKQTRATAIQIEIYCYNKIEHRKRCETRVDDIKNLTPPTWRSVCEREFEPWLDVDIRLDTAATTIDNCLEKITDFIRDRSV